VLLHALADAMLGAAGLGDIGEHFPDTDPRYQGADSMELAGHLVEIVTDRGWNVVNADMTIVIQQPKLHAYKERIRRSVADLLRVEPDRVNVKAKTKEGLDSVGENRAAEAHAVVMIAREET
jgi:2-C-methyl-D-erythritol 2,4-cyclodiphosphate synthase